MPSLCSKPLYVAYDNCNYYIHHDLSIYLHNTLYMKSFLFLLLLSLSGCYISKVGITLDADNASHLNIIAHSPVDESKNSLGYKLFIIKQKMSAKNIVLGYKGEDAPFINQKGESIKRLKYTIDARLSNGVEAERFSQIIAQEMNISLDDFWYKVSEIDDSETEKRWHLSLAFKGQSLPAGASPKFALSVKMPEKIEDFEPKQSGTNPQVTKNGKNINFTYAQIKPNQSYYFEALAVRKKAHPSTSPIVNPPVYVPSPEIKVVQSSSDTTVLLPAITAEHWFDNAFNKVLALMTAVAGLLGAWVAFRSSSKKSGSTS